MTEQHRTRNREPDLIGFPPPTSPAAETVCELRPGPGLPLSRWWVSEQWPGQMYVSGARMVERLCCRSRRLLCSTFDSDRREPEAWQDCPRQKECICGCSDYSWQTRHRLKRKRQDVERGRNKAKNAASTVLRLSREVGSSVRGYSGR